MKDIINFIGFRQNGNRLNGMTLARALRLRRKRDWTRPNICHQQIHRTYGNTGIYSCQTSHKDTYNCWRWGFVMFLTTDNQGYGQKCWHLSDHTKLHLDFQVWSLVNRSSSHIAGVVNFWLQGLQTHSHDSISHYKALNTYRRLLLASILLLFLNFGF